MTALRQIRLLNLAGPLRAHDIQRGAAVRDHLCIDAELLLRPGEHLCVIGEKLT